MYTSSKNTVTDISLESHIALSESIMLLIANYVQIHGTTFKSIGDVTSSLELNKFEFNRRIVGAFLRQRQFDAANDSDPYGDVE